MPENEEIHEIPDLLIKKMIGERLQRGSPETIRCKMKSLRICKHFGCQRLDLVKEPVTKYRTAFGVVISKRSAQILLDQFVIDDLHGSASQFPANLVPRAPNGGIGGKLP